jgi:hypothetical protein
LVAELVSPLCHLAQAGPVGINESNRTCRASSCAGWVTTAQVALLDFAGFFHIVDRAEWAGDSANFATYASTFVNDFRTRGFVNGDGFYGACVQTPSLIALGAGVRHFFPGVVEVKNFDTGFGGGKGAVVLERTRHFTLHTASAFVRVDVQYLLHVAGSLLSWHA